MTAAAPTTAELAARDVVKRFGPTTALAGVSISCGRGVTGLLGPNGAGKTTLLRILATVLEQDDGTVSLLGRDPTVPAQRAEVRRRLGYMPQEPGFHRQFTVFDFVDYVGVLKRLDDRRARHEEVRRVIEAVDLTAVRDRRLRTLSGGMRQRVALAQALLGTPELLILDEPTVGLDPEQRLRFRSMLSAVGRDSVVLLSTHLTEDVAALCADVIVIDRGTVRYSGPTAELARLADGRVWLSDDPDPEAEVFWRTGTGQFRNISESPHRGDLVPPTLEDGYLWLVGRKAEA